jgi:hypothetical protein
MTKLIGDRKGQTWAESLSFNGQSALEIDPPPPPLPPPPVYHVPPLGAGKKGFASRLVLLQRDCNLPTRFLLWEPKHHLQELLSPALAFLWLDSCFSTASQGLRGRWNGFFPRLKFGAL